MRETSYELKELLNEVEKLMNEVREIELKLKLEIKQTEKQNNNYISIMKTCVIASVMYIFLNKIIDKVFLWCLNVFVTNRNL